MARRHVARTLTVVGASVSLLAGTLAAAGSAAAEPPRRPSVDEVAAHWTPDRIASAAPRDLVVDNRGLGYLRGRDGRLQPYGHSVAAQRQPLRTLPTQDAPTPRRPPAGDDGTGPTITAMDPTSGDIIGGQHTFSATVTDESGVRSVSFTVGPDGGSSQTFNAVQTGGSTWSLTITGFTTGKWQWSVEARDNVRRGGNTTTTGPVSFMVDTGSGGGGDDPGDGGGSSGGAVVVNDPWPTSMAQVGRIYFEMPSGRNLNRPWNAYVCSGTVVADTYSDVSVVLTAAHCVYDDVNKVFARNVLFIPDQDATSGAGTDTNCANDPLGCWSPAYGVVDKDWTTRTFPDNIPWDYAYYVVPTSSAHSGAGSGGSLESRAGTVPISFDPADPDAATDALGYSYADDPNLMYCSESLGSENTYGSLWLGSCGLTGGASGGPWMQPGDQSGSGPIMSVNSWGYTNRPGMGGPDLASTSAECLFENAIGSSSSGGLVPSSC